MSNPKDLHVSNRMRELMRPIDEQIMMCDDAEDLMMLACAMLSTSKQILDLQMGVEARRRLFLENNT